LNNSIYSEIGKLVAYGLSHELIEKEDAVYCINQLLEILRLDHVDTEIVYSAMDQYFLNKEPVNVLLDRILDWANDNGLLIENTITYRDIFDSKLMNVFIPRTSEVNRTFFGKYEKSKREATDWFYHLSKRSNYIRTDRIEKNKKWKTETAYGPLDITINLSKPEKDPKAIAAAKKSGTGKYPKCFLCKENTGYLGRVDHPGRSNHRIIPLALTEEEWFMQYSPYEYYNEHCIVFKGNHDPMKITQVTLRRLLSFIKVYPHYFVGSNADLPIVGGSIMAHDHFQGGRYTFPMEGAEVLKTFKFKGFDEVDVCMIKWPLSVVRLRSENPEALEILGWEISCGWKNYSDSSVGILAETEGEKHNTITPIARFKDGKFELDLALRNNRTNSAHPYGIFHPHEEVHHLKKENIGLIEVMGLAVLPGRLDQELEMIKAHILNNGKGHLPLEIEKHEHWIGEINDKCEGIEADQLDRIIETEIGLKFAQILEYSGVFKWDEKGRNAFGRFMESIGGQETGNADGH